MLAACEQQSRGRPYKLSIVTHYDYATSSNTAPGNTLPDSGKRQPFDGGLHAYRQFLKIRKPYGVFHQADNVTELFETEIADTPTWRYFPNNSYLTWAAFH